MKYIIILILFLFGCAAPQVKKRKTLEDFKSTNSLCIDALMINMYTDKCAYISSQKIEPGIKLVSCIKYPKENLKSIYLLNNFFVITQGHRVPNNIEPLCADSSVLIATSPKNKTK